MNTYLVIALLKKWLLEQLDACTERRDTTEDILAVRDESNRTATYQAVLNELAKIEVEVLTGKDMA